LRNKNSYIQTVCTLQVQRLNSKGAQTYHGASGRVFKHKTALYYSVIALSLPCSVNWVNSVNVIHLKLSCL